MNREASVERDIEMQHRGCRIALSKWAIRYERLEAENARLREALERIYQQGKGPHVEIAREVLNG